MLVGHSGELPSGAAVAVEDGSALVVLAALGDGAVGVEDTALWVSI